MSDEILVLEYPRCGTCRKAKAWLAAHDVDYTDRHIVEAPPTKDELADWIGRSGLAIRRFFNTSGKAYRALNMRQRFADGITDEECLELLASDGMLVKRPLVVTGDTVLVGFKEAEWEDALL